MLWVAVNSTSLITVSCITKNHPNVSRVINLAKRLVLLGIFIILLASPIAFSSVGLGSTQNSYPILGYSYDTYSGSGVGGDFSYYGSSFTLNGDATITSISCELAIRYSPSQPNLITHYRYAIYRDNGAKSELIAQTETGSEKPVDGNPLAYDKWWTLNLVSPVTLHAGNYWLITVDDSQLVEIHGEQTNQAQRGICGNLGSMDFSTTLDTGNLAPFNNAVYAIYASGQGTVSTLNPPGPDASNPNATSITLGCQNTINAGKMEITGSLNAYHGGVGQGIIDFAYRDSSNYTYQPLTQTVTASDGSFAVDWTPPADGSFVINATFWGNSQFTATFKELNVLVTSTKEDMTRTVISVGSNSTVTNLAFNSESEELSFSVAGETGTAGYVDVYIDKNLVANASNIHAFIDGTEATYTLSEMGDGWLLHFTYHHSSHSIKFDLADKTEASLVPEMPQETLALIVTVLVAILLVAALLVVAQKNSELRRA